jgi:hypothetical protein
LDNSNNAEKMKKNEKIENGKKYNTFFKFEIESSNILNGLPKKRKGKKIINSGRLMFIKNTNTRFLMAFFALFNRPVVILSRLP